MCYGLRKLADFYTNFLLKIFIKLDNTVKRAFFQITYNPVYLILKCIYKKNSSSHHCRINETLLLNRNYFIIGIVGISMETALP